MGMCHPVLQILTLSQTKKCHFSHLFSDMASKKLLYHYLDWNSKKIGITYFSVSLISFGIEMINTTCMSYIPVVPSKTIPDSRPKWTKSIPIFRPKRHKNPTLCGGTYLCGLYNGVPPPDTPRTDA